MQTTQSIRHEMEMSIIKKCCGAFDRDSLTAIATKHSKLMIKKFFEEVESSSFEMPSHSDIEKMIEEGLEWGFDEEKVVADIKRTFPGWSEERVYEEVDKLEYMYEKERSKQIESITDTVVKECRSIVKDLQKEIRALKRKYTTEEE
jgi:hypothetical protein